MKAQLQQICPKGNTIIHPAIIHLIGATIFCVAIFIVAGLTSFQPLVWKLAWLALAGGIGTFGWWELAERNNAPSKENRRYLLMVVVFLALTVGGSLLPGHNSTPSMAEMIQLGWAQKAELKK